MGLLELNGISELEECDKLDSKRDGREVAEIW